MMLPSELVGATALWLALAAATLLAFLHKRARAAMPASLPTYLLLVALQALHFAEEFASGFQRLFPASLGLPIWSDVFFVSFNAVWLCAWMLAAAALLTGAYAIPSAIAVWFLALSAVGNGVAHPLLALRAGGYFPGLFTSPLVGVGGLLLLRNLLRRA